MSGPLTVEERRAMQHAMNCPATTPAHEDDCTCGLKWREELATVREDTLRNLAEALRKVAPEVIPQIIAAHAEYNRKIAARDEAFEELLAALRAEPSN